MKKAIIIIISVLIVGTALAGAAYLYGDNIYTALVFSESNIIEVEENVFRVPKDSPEIFREYMEEQGWSCNEEAQMGSMYVYEKGNQRAECIRHILNFYAEFRVCYYDK